MNKPSVRLIEAMGDDRRVVDAARVSMRRSHGDGPLLPADERLIRYLARHQHWTPFSHVMVTLHIEMPLFVARQWFKHQIGFTRNEVSRRYVDDAPTFYVPDELRSRPATSIKQGSGGKHRLSFIGRGVIRMYLSAGGAIYDMLVRCGFAPEQARMLLPQAMMTEFYETGSLAAYARLVKLRTDPHAQAEIREIAAMVDALLRQVAPVSWAALTDVA